MKEKHVHTATEPTLVTYDMPAELPLNEGVLLGRAKVALFYSRLLLIIGISSLGYIVVVMIMSQWSNRLLDINPWISLSALVLLGVSMFASDKLEKLRQAYISKQEFYYLEVPQGRVLRQFSADGGYFEDGDFDFGQYIFIEGNNRMNQLRTFSHRVDPTVSYQEGQYYNFI